MTTDNELRPASRAWQAYQKRRDARHKEHDAALAELRLETAENISAIRQRSGALAVLLRNTLRAEDAADWEQYQAEYAAEKRQAEVAHG